MSVTSTIEKLPSVFAGSEFILMLIVILLLAQLNCWMEARRGRARREAQRKQRKLTTSTSGKEKES
jgi:hypothetical protein